LLFNRLIKGSGSTCRDHITLPQLKINSIFPPRFFIQRLPMTRQYYFLIALLISVYRIELIMTIGQRQLAVCTQRRSMPRYKFNKNKATSRIRLRTALRYSLAARAIFFFHSLPVSHALSWNSSKLCDSRVATLIVSLHEKTRSILEL